MSANVIQFFKYMNQGPVAGKELAMSAILFTKRLHYNVKLYFSCSGLEKNNILRLPVDFLGKLIYMHEHRAVLLAVTMSVDESTFSIVLH